MRIEIEVVSSPFLLFGAGVCRQACLPLVVGLMKAHRVSGPEHNFEF
jgi:hypothetical protein